MHRKMIAEMNFTYGGSRLKPGDEFTATARDAFALTAYRRARLASDTSEEHAPAELVAARKPRRYRRRDMRAEDASS